MTIQSQHNVVELQVTVDDTVLVEVLERQADLGGIESKDRVLVYSGLQELDCDSILTGLA